MLAPARHPDTWWFWGNRAPMSRETLCSQELVFCTLRHQHRQVAPLPAPFQLIFGKPDQTPYFRRSGSTKRPHARHHSKSSMVSTLVEQLEPYSITIFLHFFRLQGPGLLPNAVDTGWDKTN